VVQEGYAARIYNNLDVPINVASTNDGAVTIPARERSDSLNWGSSEGVSVLAPHVGSCSVSFGFHYQIVGGNYMIVSKDQYGVSCIVYDSNHHPFVGNRRL
jgi:hypothetical protein